MAEIKVQNNEKVFQLKQFLGLNENPDGDTKLKMGEAAVLRNFRITRDRNLQRRPGTKTVAAFCPDGEPVKGLWVGMVQGVERMLCACHGNMYHVWDSETGKVEAQLLGAVNTDGDVSVFGFDGNAYILDGDEYRVFDGESMNVVKGYRPLVAIAVPPDGGGETLENINRLTNTRRCWISPDGEGTTFQLPETNIKSVDYVRDLLTGALVDPDDYTVDAAAGTVDFDAAPAQAVNSYEIGWTVSAMYRHQVTDMHYAELYAGTQDTRVFLYGDGTNKCIYTGIDYNGKPRADYFPDLYECDVGDENTPITGMIRHYSALIAFKSDSTWSISSTAQTLADGLSIPAFYVGPVNKSIGNDAPGQVQLILNSPFALFGNDLYQWQNSSYYTSNLTRDERQAKRISDRIWATLQKFDTKRCVCYDDNLAQEYYICYGGNALVYNYAADAWSYYTDFPANCLCNADGELYIGTTDGRLLHVSYAYNSDDGSPIDAYWESGSMAFNQDNMRKYSAATWIGIKPEENSEVWVSVRTDRKTTNSMKIATSSRFNFGDIDFADFLFATNNMPHMYRRKLKAKKFVFYKLIFRASSTTSSVTVLTADIKVRYTGNAK